MECRHIRLRMAELADGALMPAQQRAFESHIDACPACRAEYDALRALDGLLGEFLVPPAPAYTFANLLRRMAESDPIAAIERPLPALRVHAAAPRLAAACAVAVAGSGALGVMREGRAGVEAQRALLAGHAQRLDEAIECAADPHAPDPGAGPLRA